MKIANIINSVIWSFLANGQIDPAVQRAAKDMYNLPSVKYTWIETTRYVGIFHRVQPTVQLLKCMDRHGPKGIMDWKALGYQGNAMTVKPPPRENSKPVFSLTKGRYLALPAFCERRHF